MLCSQSQVNLRLIPQKKKKILFKAVHQRPACLLRCPQSPRHPATLRHPIFLQYHLEALSPFLPCSTPLSTSRHSPKMIICHLCLAETFSTHPSASPSPSLQTSPHARCPSLSQEETACWGLGLSLFICQQGREWPALTGGQNVGSLGDSSNPWVTRAGGAP